MSKPLSPTQTQILTSAAQHPAQLAEAPSNLPAAARNAVLQSMLKAGLIEEVLHPDSASPVLRISAVGLEAVEPSTPEATGKAATSPQQLGVGQGSMTALPNTQKAPATTVGLGLARTTLRCAAAHLLVAWDAGGGRLDLVGAVEAMRAALSRPEATRTTYKPSAPRRPREDTKQQAVLTLLRREEGTTIAQIMEATGWAQHTVRGFLAGLKKGHTVGVLERVRQVRSGAQGAKGSYSIYRAAAGEQG